MTPHPSLALLATPSSTGEGKRDAEGADPYERFAICSVGEDIILP